MHKMVFPNQLKIKWVMVIQVDFGGHKVYASSQFLIEPEGIHSEG
jgi:hypothetical protein